jgi:ATP-binding cassette subfamily B (MDR/TAP) protein 1
MSKRANKSRQIRDLQLSVSQPFGEAVQCIVQALGAIGVAFYSSWNLTLVVICSVPIVYLLMTYLSKLLSKRAHEHSDKLQQALKYVTNAIQSIEMVKCFNGERFEVQRYTSAIDLAGRLYKRQANIRSLQLGVIQFFTLSIFVQGFWYGSNLVRSGQKDAGQVLTTFWAALLAVTAVTEFLPQFIILQKGKVAGARLRALMGQISRSDSMMEAEGHERPAHCAGDVVFENVSHIPAPSVTVLTCQVSFAYPSRPGQLAIRDVSMSFPVGKTTFVIGRSGSGKSTLGQLLVRFYQATSGHIRLDGVSLHQLDPLWLREQVTLVEQHSVLFNFSIRRNIALGKIGRAASPEEVEQVITFAMLQEMITALPNRLDTELGMHGNNLSGGQRQRMALARARLRDTPVLILDESTSALDYITRSAIINSIRIWRQGKTTIIITHDVSQVSPDDAVYVMDNARVVQQGLRKVLEADPHSAFHTLVDQPETDEVNDALSSSDETDDIIFMYAGSWNAEPLPRPSTAALFRQSIISPFLSPRMPPRAPNSVASLSTRPSIDLESDSALERLDKTQLSHAAAYDMFEKTFKPRPSSRPISQRVSVASRPVSVTSYHSVLSDVCDTRLRARPSLHFKIQSKSKDKPSFRRAFRAKTEKHRERRSADIKSVDVVETLDIWQIATSVWPLVGWPTRLTLIAAVLCALIHSAATPTFGYVFAQLLSTFYAAGNQRQLAQIYAIAILVIAVVDGLATYGYNALFDISAQTWANTLKAEGMKRVLSQPREFFDREENSVSRITECLDQFAEEARNLPGRFVGILIVMVFCIGIVITWSLISCWKLTLMALPCLAVMYCITRVYNAISNRWERFSNEADEHVGQALHETFVNIRTVRCLVLEEIFGERYREATLNALKIGTKRSIYSGSVFGLNYASSFFVTAFLFWWGAYIVSKGDFSPTDIIETFNILMLSVGHVSHIGNYIPQINIARDAGSRLIRLARLPQDSHELEGTDQLFKAGDIALENVNFAYPTRKEHQVLHNVSFDIPRGSCTAIVGSSGSGKSTIAALLLKLYQTTAKSSKYSPEVSISRHDIKRLHTSTVRSCIAVVSQTPVLFPGTIKENITYGLSPSSSRTALDNVRAAAQAAGVADFIDSLPQAYQTIVGDGGTGLSGGQAQRIAIARALVRDPDILILDEATSALDVESSAIVRDTIHRLVRESKRDYELGDHSGRVSRVEKRKRMTVIILTHAREMMAIAENIVMLDRGRVVEEGSFEELKRKRRGPFARLLRGEQLEAPESGMF